MMNDLKEWIAIGENGKPNWLKAYGKTTEEAEIDFNTRYPSRGRCTFTHPIPVTDQLEKSIKFAKDLNNDVHFGGLKIIIRVRNNEYSKIDKYKNLLGYK